MQKLTIFLFDNHDRKDWQQFMMLAEKMPGLRRETVSEVNEFLFGNFGRGFNKIHEFYFDSRQALNAALQSEEGQAAGAWLHEFTHKRFSMMIAEHKEAIPEEFKKTES